MSKGGILDIYLDGEKIDTYECYSKNAKSEKIVIAQDLSKGKHTFKAIFKGAKKGVDYKKSEPCMYVGTEKSTVLNLTAKLKGKDAYHTYADYTSPNYDGGDIAEAPTIFDDNITNKDELRERLKEELNDQPTVEVSTNYLGSVEDKQYITNDDIKENNKIRFIHQPLGFNLDLKVVKITVSHPLLDEPVEVDFSNSPKDILKMQQQTTKAIRKFNKQSKGDSLSESPISMDENYSDIVGVTLLDD
uniref:Tail spike domain-containing protein n=1 Tax=Staphylococcus xylosus TaxID=1288 RepID=A0A077RDB4_STAXY|nr:hypothetical protein [Staphylococcus xylosus]